MSQILDEQLSAFLDGELPMEEVDLLLARLERDPACRATLARYGLISECLRSPAHPGAVHIATRVRASLDAAGEAGPVSVGERSGRAWGGWLAAGLAASIAVLAALILGPGSQTSQQALPVAVPQPVARNVPAAPRPLGAARMTNYLVLHSSYTSAPFRGSLDSHLIAGRVARTGWQSAEDGRNGQ